MAGLTLGVPFFEDERELDRSLWRVLISVPSGLVAALVAAALSFFVVFLFLLVPPFTGLTEHLFQPNGFHNLMSRLNNPDTIGSDLLASIALLMMIAVINLAGAVAFVAVACALHHRAMRSYLTSAPRFRWRLLFMGTLLYAAFVWPYLARESWPDILAGHSPMVEIAPTLARRLMYVSACVLLFGMAALAEEMVFRGWFLRHSFALMRLQWLSVILSALLFSLAHGENNIDALVARTVMGLGFAYMTLRMGGIEFAVGAHMAHNLLISLLLRPMSLAPTPADDPAPNGVPEILVLAVAYVVMTELVMRWRPLRHMAGLGPAAEQSSPDALA